MSKGENTRREILIKSLELFASKGVQNVTTQEIADAVGIKQTGIYRYFKDRNVLLADAISLAAEEGRQYFAKKISDNIDALSLLNAHIEINLRWVAEHRPFNIGFLSVHYFSSQIAEIEKVQAEITTTRTHRFQGIIEQGNREQCWEVKSSDKAAQTLHNYLLGEMLALFNNLKSEPFKKRVSRVQHVSQKLIQLF